MGSECPVSHPCGVVPASVWPACLVL